MTYSLDFHLPTRIIFGLGRIRELRKNLPPGIKRIVVATDPSVAEASGVLPAMAEQLEDLEVGVFDEVEPNPSLATVENGAALARDFRADLIIGAGGGSPMDAAKGIALLATNDGAMTDYMSRDELHNTPLPVICIPTTSGTGSEVTPYAVFTNPDDQSKGGYSNPGIFPTVSIIDPELTFSMPESVVIDTGLDALTHAIEAYLSTLSSPLSDMFALRAIEIIRDRLAAAAANDADAMCDISFAAMTAGVAIAHAGTILLHVMGYPLTVFHDVPHGRANAALLPAFMEFMKKRSRARDKIACLEGIFEPAAGIAKFVSDLGVSTNLVSYGVAEDEIDTFVDKCVVKDDLRITPADVTGDDIRDIFTRALGAD